MLDLLGACASQKSSLPTPTSAWVAAAGTYTVRVGASSRAIKQQATFRLPTAQVVLKSRPLLVPQQPIADLKASRALLAASPAPIPPAMLCARKLNYAGRPALRLAGWPVASCGATAGGRPSSTFPNLLAFQNPDKSVVVAQNDGSNGLTVRLRVGGRTVSPLLPANSFNTFIFK